MLIRFSVGNFLSFKDVVTLDMAAEALKEKKDNLHIPYLYSMDLPLVKSMTVYGHNSHGKSNLLKAYAFYKKFILNSFTLGKALNNEIGVEPFLLNAAMQEKPTFFEAVFIIKETKYRYGFMVNKQKVIEEWLYYAESKVRENSLFHRYEQEFRDISKGWNKDSGGKVDQARIFTKQSSLFISVLLSQDGIPRIDHIYKWFKGNVVLTGTNYEAHINGGAASIYSKSEYRHLILKFIKGADLGFTSIFDKISNIVQKEKLHAEVADFIFEIEKSNFELYTSHKVYDHNNDFVKSIEFELIKNESSGSIKYFIIACFLAYSIIESQLIWIDELDSSLHTNLLEALVLTYNHKDINLSGAQLIFTTHNTILLDNKLRRDQIILVEKDDFGISRISKLHTSENPIRINKSIEKEYREGNRGVSKKLKKGNNPNQTLFDFE